MTSESLPYLPYGRHVVDDADIRAVERVLKSDYLTSGSVTTAFETKLAEKTGAKNAVSVSSGTAALHLSALSLNLGPGDIVVAPTITFIATANAVRYVGAEVVAMKVIVGATTISPGPRFNESAERCKAAVPLETLTAFLAPVFSASFVSNAVVTEPEVR
jgi:dTDP-4-amino-4,6-dideoxygalactose transaminase